MLTVVISYEIVRRYGVRLEQQAVARALEQERDAKPHTEDKEVSA